MSSYMFLFHSIVFQIQIPYQGKIHSSVGKLAPKIPWIVILKMETDKCTLYFKITSYTLINITHLGLRRGEQSLNLWRLTVDRTVFQG